MGKKYKILLIIIGFGFLLFASPVLAQVDAGINEINNTIALGNRSPLETAARVVNVAMLFLGIIAVGIILLGGFKWMQSQGSEEKISEAKKILKAGAIGLVIVLSAWGITVFVLKQLIGSTGGNPNDSGMCVSGQTTTCGCGGTMTCSAGNSWGPCLGSNCNPGPGDDGEQYCDGDALLPGCQMLPGKCSPYDYCDTDCICKSLGNQGDSCNSATDGTCAPNNDKCSEGLTCDSGTCTCDGPVVITGVSPVGGFCEKNPYRACSIDLECNNNTGPCNIDTPNGTKGNLITIFGKNFSKINASSSIFKAEFGTATSSDGFVYPISAMWGQDNSRVEIKDQIDAPSSPRTFHFVQYPGVVYDQNNSNSRTMGAMGVLKLMKYNSITNSFISSSILEMKPGKQYAVSFKYKGSLANKLNIKLNLGVYSSAFSDYRNGKNSTSSKLVNLGEVIPDTYYNWKNFQYSFFYTQDMEDKRGTNSTYSNYLMFYLDYGSTGNGTDFYIDDVQIYDLSDRAVVFQNTDYNTQASGTVPALINSNCVNSWFDNQITVVDPGASKGPIKVVIGNESDSTNNENGANIKNYVNTFARPGLCAIDPSSTFGGGETYLHGVNLLNVSGENGVYFGDYKNGQLSSTTYISSTSVKTVVPSNISSGLMSVFFKYSKQNSNFLFFNKLNDLPSPPSIGSISPTSGRDGQYITISGTGFGDQMGKVYFSDDNNNLTEGSFNFPVECASSLWSDNQIIVKAPTLTNGQKGIAVQTSSWTVNSKDKGIFFTYDSSLPLKPGLCKVEPNRGPVNSPVWLWGEYFGPTGQGGKVTFNFQKTQNSAIAWVDNRINKIETTVPSGAVSGGVFVTSPAAVNSNTVNFTVGECQNNNDCSGGKICCPAVSTKKGQCVQTSDDCYVNIPSSIFEWTFKTASSTGGDNPPPGDLTSCLGISKTLGLCKTNTLCPNSPGQCSAKGATEKVGGACCSAGYTFDGTSGHCASTRSCDVSTNFSFNNGSQVISVTKICQALPGYGNQKHFTFSYSGSCPANWTKIAGNICVDSTSNTQSTCNICNTGETCENTATGAKCTVNTACSGNESCVDKSGVFKCVSTEEASCDCCCRIDNSAQDCCAPLTCSGTCGSDTSDDGQGLGVCSGCAAAGSDTASRDQACNCTNHSGKFCQVDSANPSGACVDCASLDETGCLQHSGACCFDEKNQVCQGGAGPASLGGKCAYYACSGNTCNANPLTIGPFSNLTDCQAGCSGTPPVACDGDGNTSGCQADNNKCSNGQTCNTNSCICETTLGNPCDGDGNTSGCQADNNKCSNGQTCNTNTCACETIGSDVLVACDDSAIPGCQANDNKCFGGKTCNTSTCLCEASGGFGLDCADTAANCSVSMCANPFSCLTPGGTPATGNVGDSCGTCCCTPGTNDVCKNINPSLSCLADKGDCSGGSRGLCCGCTTDSGCGSNTETVGCGTDSCCYGRPDVIYGDVSPSNQQEGVCRNTQIEIPFNTQMDRSSLNSDNIVLLEEHPANFVCASSSLQDLTINIQKESLVAKTYHRLVSAISSVFSYLRRDRATASGPLDTNNYKYCVVPGNISTKEVSGGTIALFKPKKALLANTFYFIMVKGGDKSEDKQGVLNIQGVTMHGKGWNFTSQNEWVDNLMFNSKYYPNSVLSKFKTSGEVCQIDYVTISPNQTLFNRADNDAGENDSDYNNATFNTIIDRDQTFEARAYSSDDQLLTPITGYSWDWKFSIDDKNIVDFANPVPANLPGNQTLVVAQTKFKEGNTLLRATVNMDRFKTGSCSSAANCAVAGNCCNAYFGGEGKKTSAQLYLLICANPWPAIKADNTWTPWHDNCLLAQGLCNPYNYDIYYCRDAGGPGTADDLPAISDANAIIRGNSTKKVCSKSGVTCSLNSDCASGEQCILDVLKELYFFRGGN